MAEIHDNYRLVVYPRQAGDFGICSISGMNRTHEEELRILREIRSAILDLPDYRIVSVEIKYDTENPDRC